MADCSVLYLAEKIDASLLTNDWALRQEAATRHIKVHGTIWIFDQLIAKGVLAASIAVEKLEVLLRSERHLPSSECQDRLAKWRKVK